MQEHEKQSDLAAYRESDSEKLRVLDLIGNLPTGLNSVLDVGARDGFISRKLAERVTNVVALDLECPSIVHERIQCMAGDVTRLGIADATFDLVLCAEVLEHIPANQLDIACQELARVSKQYLLIGVPYKQDIRVGQTTCQACGKVNPPYGHVNSFDEGALARLFRGLTVVNRSYVGESFDRTNPISSFLMGLAGNPFGTYFQDEPCVHCDGDIGTAAMRRPWQKAATRLAHWGNVIQRPTVSKQPYWIHTLFQTSWPKG